MGFSDILGLLGGLALFLYGMKVMGEGLELMAGSRLKSILESLTRNRVLAMLVGAGLTALIQSSNAMTAMTVGFVNAGLMGLGQAVGVIMGAKIGTTITGQLIALQVNQIAPIFAFIGVILFLFVKKKQIRYVGQVLTGLGILFMGMNNLSSAMAPLKDMPWFQIVVMKLDSPIIGVLVGTVFTMLVQSCSASIGVLQAMAMQGLVSLSGSIYVLFGLNIGTVGSAIMAAIGANKNAKRVVVVHLLFNVIGTVVFMVLLKFLPIVEWMETMAPDNVVAQIANTNTLFSVATTAMLLPCAPLLTRLAQLIIPGEDRAAGPQLLHINDSGFGASSIAIAQADAEAERMFGLARKNLSNALDCLFDKSVENIKQIYENEETIDFLNKEITRALVRINSMELAHRDAKRMSRMYHVLSDIERIGDHAENVAEYAVFCREHGESFSIPAVEELHELSNRVLTIVDEAYAHFKNPEDENMTNIERQEESIDQAVDALEKNHVDRLNAHQCSADLGMVFVEILTDLERVADHALNIAQAAKN